MKFKPQNCPFPHRPYKALVSPRPIAWVSTRGTTGDNLAPYSFFNQFSDEPLLLGFSASPAHDRDIKDSAANIIETGEFCVNTVGYDNRYDMVNTSKPEPRGQNEFQISGIENTECEQINCARVSNAPASFECKIVETIKLPGGSLLFIGEAVFVHIRDDIVDSDRVDIERYQPLARLGYGDYAHVETVYELKNQS